MTSVLTAELGSLSFSGQSSDFSIFYSSLAAGLGSFGLSGKLADLFASSNLVTPIPTEPVTEDEIIYTPIAPGVAFEDLPLVTIVDTTPSAIIGGIADTVQNAQGRLNTLFPAAVIGDGVIERRNGDMWVYDGSVWNNVGPNPGPTIQNFASIILPYNEIAIYYGRLRAYPIVEKFEHALSLLTEIDIATKVQITAYRVKLLDAAVGNPLVSGAAANLLFGRKLTASAGNFDITSFGVGGITEYNIEANAGLFTTTGEQSEALFWYVPLSAKGAAFEFSGENSSSISGIILSITESGDFILTGQDATSPQKYLGAELGSFLVDSTAVNLNSSLVLEATGQDYLLNGQDTVLQFAEAIKPVKVLFYTGNGATGRSITGAGFEPGFVAIKGRSFAMNHAWHDIVRGKNTAGYRWVRAGEQAAEQIPDTGSTVSTRGVQDFTADGFTMNGSSVVNFSSGTYFTLCLKKGSAVSANNNGSIATQVSALSELEYSTFTYTGNGGANQSIGHGLSGAPDLVIVKQRTGNFSWVGGTVVGDNNSLRFYSNETLASGTSIFKTYSSSTIDIGDTLNQSSSTYCGWAFKAKAGRSAIATFTGSGSGQQVVTLGYKPQFVMIKNFTSTTGDWLVYYRLDATTGYAKELKFNTTAAEVTSTTVQITSTGFTVDVGGPGNVSGGTTSALYLAFADFSPIPPTVMVADRGSYAVSGSSSNGATVYNVTNSGASDYLINEVADPTLTVFRGTTYIFEVNAPGHPFWLQTTPGAYDSLNTYSTGVTNGGTAEGRITWQVALDTPSLLYYVCQNHSSMNGQINVVNYLLKLDAGNITVDGQSSILQPAIRIFADSGEFIIEGQTSGSIGNSVLSGASGSYEVSVENVALTANLILAGSDDYFSSWATQVYGYEALINIDWWAD